MEDQQSTQMQQDAQPGAKEEQPQGVLIRGPTGDHRDLSTRLDEEVSDAAPTEMCALRRRGETPDRVRFNIDRLIVVLEVDKDISLTVTRLKPGQR
jgi:hypothetical protein